MLNYPQMLIVAGTGQNVGKTSLACALIEQVSLQNNVIGIKISPHFHEISSSGKLIMKSENFEIVEELNDYGHKDSSRMLKAGAKRVFYVQTKKDDILNEVMIELQKYLTKDVAIICESGGLRHFVEPGLFLVCRSKDQFEMKQHLKILEPKVDQFILYLMVMDSILIFQKLNLKIIDGSLKRKQVFNSIWGGYTGY